MLLNIIIGMEGGCFEYVTLDLPDACNAMRYEDLIQTVKQQINTMNLSNVVFFGILPNELEDGEVWLIPSSNLHGSYPRTSVPVETHEILEIEDGEF